MTTVRGEPSPAERRRRWPWIAAGLALEAAALGGIAAMLARESRREDPLHEITKYSLRLAWQDVLHQHRLLLLLLLCVLAYVGGAVLVAEPFVDDRRYLFIAIPIAAVASLLILGIAAFLVWIVVASDGSGLDVFDWWSPGSGKRRKAKVGQSSSTAPPGSDAPRS
jgi:hypothetical protein